MAGKRNRGCLVWLLIVIGVILVIPVPPVGIVMLLLGFYLLYKNRKQSKQTKREDQVSQIQHNFVNVEDVTYTTLFAKWIVSGEGDKSELQKLLGHNREYVEERLKIARPIRVNDFHAGLYIERQEMIEITWISGRKQIYMVGKEGDKCHCFRLKSNDDIIKIKKYSTEYPFDLIHTQRAKHNKHEYFEQVSLDKKTNTEKTKRKKLVSWRLFERQNKLEPEYLALLGGIPIFHSTSEYQDVYDGDEVSLQQSLQLQQMHLKHSLKIQQEHQEKQPQSPEYPQSPLHDALIDTDSKMAEIREYVKNIERK